MLFVPVVSVRTVDNNKRKVNIPRLCPLHSNRKRKKEKSQRRGVRTHRMGRGGTQLRKGGKEAKTIVVYNFAVT